MIGRVHIRSIAHRVPRWLRHLRAQALLESRAVFMGIEEVECPACRGGGWLDLVHWERCPLCMGFRELPRSLAVWFHRQVTGESTRARLQAMAFGRGRAGAPCRGRHGRIADHPHRMADLDAGSYDDFPRDLAS